jgi:hypothetical protein
LVEVATPRFRATEATMVAEVESTLPLATWSLGHSSTRVTEVYLHSSRTRTAAAVGALTEYRRENRQTETDL